MKIDTDAPSEPLTVAESAPRTLQEARLDARYGKVFHELCERLYDRADFTIGVLTLIGGSGSIAAALKSNPQLAIPLAAVFASLSICSRLWGAGRKAERHAVAKKAFAELVGESHAKTFEQMEQALAKLDGASPSGFSGLRMPAYNINARDNGFKSYCEPLTKWEAFLCALV